MDAPDGRKSRRSEHGGERTRVGLYILKAAYELAKRQAKAEGWSFSAWIEKLIIKTSKMEPNNRDLPVSNPEPVATQESKEDKTEPNEGFLPPSDSFDITKYTPKKSDGTFDNGSEDDEEYGVHDGDEPVGQ